MMQHTIVRWVSRRSYRLKFWFCTCVNVKIGNSWCNVDGVLQIPHCTSNLIWLDRETGPEGIGWIKSPIVLIFLLDDSIIESDCTSEKVSLTCTELFKARATSTCERNFLHADIPNCLSSAILRLDSLSEIIRSAVWTLLNVLIESAHHTRRVPFSTASANLRNDFCFVDTFPFRNKCCVQRPRKCRPHHLGCFPQDSNPIFNVIMCKSLLQKFCSSPLTKRKKVQLLGDYCNGCGIFVAVETSVV